jgi:hypothetical protein
LDTFRDDFGLAGDGTGAGPREIFGLVGAREAAAFSLWSRRQGAAPVMVLVWLPLWPSKSDR